MAWNFDTMKEALSEMEKVDYQEFIKAFLSLELSISDRTILNQVYQDYMDEEEYQLVKAKFDALAPLVEKEADIEEIDAALAKYSEDTTPQMKQQIALEI